MPIGDMEACSLFCYWHMKSLKGSSAPGAFSATPTCSPLQRGQERPSTAQGDMAAEGPSESSDPHLTEHMFGSFLLLGVGLPDVTEIKDLDPVQHFSQSFLGTVMGLVLSYCRP